MKFGCLLALFLLPISVLIWAKKERRRRAALPPDELKKIENEEDFGSVNKDLECIYCHKKDCVRTKIEALYDDGTDAHTPEGIALLLTSSSRYSAPQKDEHILAHCMSCGSHWKMFPPEETNR